MSNNHKSHLFGVSERIIKKIILECLDDKLLFNKLEDEIADYINSGGVDSKLEDFVQKKIDTLKEQILDGVDVDFDTLKEIADWINEHQDLYNSLLLIVKDKVQQNEFNEYKDTTQEIIKKLQNQVNELQEQVTSLTNEILYLRSKNLVVGEPIKDKDKIQKPQFDAMFGGMGVTFV